MQEAIMKELILLGKSIIVQARRKGFDVMVMLAVWVVFGFWIVRLDNRLSEKDAVWEAREERLNQAWSAKLNDSNIRILECERDRYDLSLRVAVLEYQLGIKKKR